ncbi:tetratricopeptide repeat protein [Aureliella helgolandensis]|uniref:Uncharacterized protein n=1 Tax=Aureliella helgolandensis TaxID=2527968 RepID=A0A518GE45_9BACT|nr:hypothetical protein [Aureliella helgolandensis]QDV26874.1 hypothetical protein Q31a_52530 [Aureliella helgolandensis]
MKITNQASVAALLATALGNIPGATWAADGVILQPRYRAELQQSQSPPPVERSARTLPGSPAPAPRSLLPPPQVNQQAISPAASEPYFRGAVSADTTRELNWVPVQPHSQVETTVARPHSLAPPANSVTANSVTTNSVTTAPIDTSPRTAVQARGAKTRPGPLEIQLAPPPTSFPTNLPEVHGEIHGDAESVELSGNRQGAQEERVEFGPSASLISITRPPYASPHDGQALQSQASSRNAPAAVPQSILETPPQISQLQNTSLPPGWQAVRERLTQHMQVSEGLIRRKAYLSAQEETELAIAHLFQVLDQYSGGNESARAWQAAQQAFREADDFQLSQRIDPENQTLLRLVNSHETSILKGIDLANLSPMSAAAYYREFAEQQLIAAAQMHPWASELYYVAGRTLQAQAESANLQLAQSLKQNAVSFYHAAAAIKPSNAIATNQLGFILLQMDRPAEARQALLASLDAKPSLPALENLVETSRRLNDQETLQWALQNYEYMQSSPHSADAMPQVMEVTPQIFAQLSPRSSGPAVPNFASPNYSPANYTDPMRTPAMTTGYSNYLPNAAPQ